MSPLEFQRSRAAAEASAAASDASRLANELRREFPTMTRTEALREAERIQRERGLGWVVQPA